MGVLSNVCCLAGVAKLSRPMHRNCHASSDTVNCTQAVDPCKVNRRITRSGAPSEFRGSGISDSRIRQTSVSTVGVSVLVSLVLVCCWLESPLAIVAIVSYAFVYRRTLCEQVLALSFKARGSLRLVCEKVSVIATARSAFTTSLWDNARSLHKPSEGRVISARQSCATAAIDAAVKAEKAPCATEMTKQVRAEFLDGSAHWVTVQDAERQLRAADGDAALAMRQLRTSIVWRKDVFAEWLETDVPDISESEFRVIALGHENRPMLYFCSVHQAPRDVIARQLACAIDRAIQKYCTAEQQQVDIVFDCHGCRPFLDPNVGAWIKLAGAFPAYFAERIHRVVVLDFSVLAGTIWRACKPALPPKTIKKICFASRSQDQAMQAIWDLCVSPDVSEMVDSLLKLNLGAAVQRDRESIIAGRDSSHRLSNTFLQTQTYRQQHAVTTKNESK